MTPEEIEKTKQQFLQTMGSAVEMIFSDANPYFRAAQRIAAGESSDAAFTEELYGDKETAEARAWLEEGALRKQKRYIHKYSPRKTKKVIDELYAAGATSVRIADIERHEDVETSNVIVVFLPKDKAQRNALGAIHEREMSKVWCYEPRKKAKTPSGSRLLFQYT